MSQPIITLIPAPFQLFSLILRVLFALIGTSSYVEFSHVRGSNLRRLYEVFTWGLSRVFWGQFEGFFQIRICMSASERTIERSEEWVSEQMNCREWANDRAQRGVSERASEFVASERVGFFFLLLLFSSSFFFFFFFLFLFSSSFFLAGPQRHTRLLYSYVSYTCNSAPC